MYKKITLAFILFLTFFGQVQAKNSDIISNKDISNIVTMHANQLLQDSRFVSTSIGVVTETDSVILHFGELTRHKKNTPTDNTIYEIGSVSKTMTGLITAYAVKDGKLSLDDNINKYVNNKLNKLSTEKNPVTVRQLLTHSSGLPRGYLDLGLKVETLSKTSFLKSLNNVNPSENKGKYHYSSAGIELLSYILETVYQMPFDNLLQQVLSTEANMKDTKVNLAQEQLKDVAYGYNEKGEVAKAHLTPEILWGGSGYIKTTMSDLVKYMKLQLKEENKAIKESHRRLFHVGGTDHIAYSWIAAEDENLGCYYIHHGGLEGTQNWMIIFPDRNIAVSIVTNSSFPEAAGLMRKTGMAIIKNLK